MCYNENYRKLQKIEFLVNLQKFSQFGLYAETRLHEAGITSNRASQCRGEYVTWPCTHRPSHAENRFCLKI
jgi:hypothetical protein